jgi:hypothetical protein
MREAEILKVSAALLGSNADAAWPIWTEGSLVSTTYERGKGKSKKARTNKQTFWCMRGGYGAFDVPGTLYVEGGFW